MKLKLVLKVIFYIMSILSFTVVGFMYTNLSFIDWPYLWAGIFFSFYNYFLKFNIKGIIKKNMPAQTQGQSIKLKLVYINPTTVKDKIDIM